jgi:hypothetical protein
VKIEGKSIFYVSCGIALAAIAVFILGIANSTSFAPLDLSGRLTRAEARREEQVRKLVMDQHKP